MLRRLDEPGGVLVGRVEQEQVADFGMDRPAPFQCDATAFAEMPAVGTDQRIEQSQNVSQFRPSAVSSMTSKGFGPRDCFWVVQ